MPIIVQEVRDIANFNRTCTDPVLRLNAYSIWIVGSSVGKGRHLGASLHQLIERECISHHHLICQHVRVVSCEHFARRSLGHDLKPAGRGREVVDDDTCRVLLDEEVQPRTASSPMARAIHDGNAAREDARARHSAAGSVRCRAASDSWTWVGPIQAKARTAAPAGPLPKASIQRGACLTRTSDRPSFSFWVRPDVT